MTDTQSWTCIVRSSDNVYLQRAASLRDREQAFKRLQRDEFKGKELIAIIPTHLEESICFGPAAPRKSRKNTAIDVWDTTWLLEQDN